MENKIRIARKKKGYTQEELAYRVGCSVKTNKMGKGKKSCELSIFQGIVRKFELKYGGFFE